MKASKQSSVDTTTLPTDELMWCLLGDIHSGNECRVIPNRLGTILILKFKDSLVYKVVQEGDGTYTLWWYNAWYNDSERRRKMKEYSEQIRVANWLMKENTEDLAGYIVKQASVPFETARAMAYNILRNPNCMPVVKFYGMKKIKTKIEELTRI